MICVQAVATRPIAVRKEDVRIGNYLSILPTYLGLESDLEKSIEAVQRNNASVSMWDIVGLVGNVEISNDLPFGLNWYLFKIMSMKQCFVLSSMPGPRQPWDFKLKSGEIIKGVSMVGVGPPVVDLATGMFLSTCGENINMAMVTDTHYFDNIDEFIGNFKRFMLDFSYPEKA